MRWFGPFFAFCVFPGPTYSARFKFFQSMMRTYAAVGNETFLNNSDGILWIFSFTKHNGSSETAANHGESLL